MMLGAAPRGATAFIGGGHLPPFATAVDLHCARPKGGWTCLPIKRRLGGQPPFPLAAAPTALLPCGWLSRSRTTLLPPFETAVIGPAAV
jgi:hypothetical protein